jgi:hypothetical protein
MPNFLTRSTKNLQSSIFFIVALSSHLNNFTFLNSTKAQCSFSWFLFKLYVHLLTLTLIFIQALHSLMFFAQFHFVFYVFYSSCCVFLATFVELSSFIFLDRQFHVFLHSFNLWLFALLCFICTLFAYVLISVFSCFWIFKLLVFVSFESFYFVFFFQLLNPISRNFNFFVCASLCIDVSNFTKTFFSSL